MSSEASSATSAERTIANTACRRSAESGQAEAPEGTHTCLVRLNTAGLSGATANLHPPSSSDIRKHPKSAGIKRTRGAWKWHEIRHATLTCKSGCHHLEN